MSFLFCSFIVRERVNTVAGTTRDIVTSIVYGNSAYTDQTNRHRGLINSNGNSVKIQEKIIFRRDSLWGGETPAAKNLAYGARGWFRDKNPSIRAKNPAFRSCGGRE